MDACPLGPTLRGTVEGPRSHRSCARAEWAGSSRRAYTAFLGGTFGLLLWLGVTCDRAAAATPGGVAGAYLWFLGSNYSSGTWTDAVGTTLNSQPIKAGSSNPVAVSLDANFNPGVSFNGSTQWLRGAANKSILGSARTYIFGVSRWNGSTTPYLAGVLEGYPTSGPQPAGEGLGFTDTTYKYLADAKNNSQGGPFAVAASGPTTPYIVSDVMYPAASLNGAIASQNGLPGSSATTSEAVTAGTNFELGGRTVNGFASRLFSGTIDEVILYDNLASALTATQISQIRSYLAIKYGITLGYNTNSAVSTGTNYLSSASATVWSGATNAAYQYDVAGIARDDTSGLDQRVSHSVNPSALDVTIANGTSIATTSSGAPNTAFSSNATAVMWGDDNGSTSLSVQSGLNRMTRVWRTQTTGSGSTQLTVQVPLSAFSGMSSPKIIVAASNTGFASGTATSLTCGATVCTATIATFSSGSTQYFTFSGAATAAPSNLQAQVDSNSVGLLWTAVSGASYSVYRGTSSGAETLLASVAAVTSASTYPIYHDLSAVNGATYYYTVTAVVGGVESSASAEVTAALPSYSSYPALAFQVAASSAAVGSYAGDGGIVQGAGSPSVTAHSVDTTSAINSSAVTALYQTERFATAFYYTLTGLREGASYIVRLHEAELHYGTSSGPCTSNNCTGTRVFNVTINGAAVLTSFDIWAQAGAVYTAIGRDFVATADGSGQIFIGFCSTASLTTPTTCTAPANGADKAKIDGIQLFSAPPAVTLTLSASTSTPRPGDDITYTSTFVNSGAAPSVNTKITVPVPSPSCFKVGTASQPTGTAGVTATITYSNNGGSSFGYTPVSGACGTASNGYDVAVTHVLWTIVGTIAATSTSNSGGVTLSARVP